MSETVKNKHMKKKNPIGLVFKTINYCVSSFPHWVCMYSFYGISEECDKSGK